MFILNWDRAYAWMQSNSFTLLCQILNVTFNVINVSRRVTPVFIKGTLKWIKYKEWRISLWWFVHISVLWFSDNPRNISSGWRNINSYPTLIMNYGLKSIYVLDAKMEGDRIRSQVLSDRLKFYLCGFSIERNHYV